MSSKKAIICVDDEKIVLETLQRQLINAFGKDFAYEMAEDVNEAWEVIVDLADEGYDIVLVISDWLMPGTKGDKFLVDLHKEYPTTVKILLTGQADEEAIRNAFDNANLLAYMQKPWNQAQLIESIAKAFDSRN
jgi:DNA-binding NtrC family response regulator